MRRLLWIALAVAAAGTALWLLAGPPREYFLRQECARFHQQRMERFNLLRFQRARAAADVAPRIDRQMDELLRETRTVTVRGWEVVLVPAGALPPVRGHVRKVTCDPSAPGDPAPVRGPMTVWLKPVGWLARLLG
jgi:hypothetical protein